MDNASSSGKRIVMYVEARSCGGTMEMVKSVAEGLASRFTVEIVCADDPALASCMAGRGDIGIHRCALKNVQQFSGWVEIPRLIRIFRVLRTADIVHCHLHTPFACLPVIVLAKLLRKKVVVTEHALGVLVYLRRRKLPRLLSAVRELRIAVQMQMKKLSLRCVDTIVTVSEAYTDLLRTTFPGHVPPLMTIYNGIDPEQFQAGADRGAALRQQLGISTQPIPRVVTVIAALNNAKGHRYLLQAAPAILRRFPDTMFIFAGDGHLLGELQVLAGNLSVASHVIFSGHRNDIPELLAITDVAVLPSLFESLGLSIQEAMAAGKPVVATRVGGIPELVEDGVTGFLVPSADSDQLAAKVIMLLEDASLRAEFGARGQERVRLHFHRQQMIEHHAALYESLFAERRNVPGHEPAAPHQAEL